MAHPVRLLVEDDLRRSRATVLFRPLLVLPPALWGSVWGIFTCATVALAWLVALASGRVWRELHALNARYLRWHLHLLAYLFLVANPFPGFGGRRGYPVDVALEPSPRQPRLVTLLRPLLALPAIVFASVLGSLLVASALLAFVPCLLRGRIPRGLRDLEAYCLHFWVQTLAYLVLVTPRYPTLTYEPGGAALTPS